MLLESVLAEFSEESAGSRRHHSEMPFVWDDQPPPTPYFRSTSYRERIGRLRVQENEGLYLNEEAADMFGARKNFQGPLRSDSGHFYHKEGTVPFKWEAAPGKPAVAQEPLIAPESPRLQLPPALRNAQVPAGCHSPRHVGLAGKVKSILSGKGSRSCSSISSSSSNLSSASSSKSSLGADREQWSSSSGREDTDRDSAFDSDGGEELSPVSCADAGPISPISPLSPKPEYPNLEQLSIVPLPVANKVEVQSNPHSNSARILSRNGSGKLTSVHASGFRHHPLINSILPRVEMSEELPIIVEDDEESEFHTMEFTTMDSPSTIEERRERSLSRRSGSSKSLSAPVASSRRQSSLGNGSRPRRRSDFDWPEDYDDRPEEVVKEVDDSLWAFSPVSSSFVFAGNDTGGFSGRSPRAGRNGTGSSTPTSGGSGSVRESSSLRRTLMKSASTRNGYNGKSSAEAAAAYAEYMSQPGPSGRSKSLEDDEVYHQVRHNRLKKTFSCIPFLNICRAQRPTPTISFSSRLSPNIVLDRR